MGRVADLLGFLNGEPADQHPHESSDVESSRNGDHHSDHACCRCTRHYIAIADGSQANEGQIIQLRKV